MGQIPRLYLFATVLLEAGHGAVIVALQKCPVGLGGAFSAQELVEQAVEGDGLLQRQGVKLAQLLGDTLRFALQGSALVGEGYVQVALVLGGAGAGNDPLDLQLLEKRGKRTRIQEKVVTDLLDGQGIVLPEQEHGDILGVSQIQFIQVGLIELDDLTGSGIQGKADLVLQTQELTFCTVH